MHNHERNEKQGTNIGTEHTWWRRFDECERLGPIGLGLATDDLDDRSRRTHQCTFSKRSGFSGDIGEIGTGT